VPREQMPNYVNVVITRPQDAQAKHARELFNSFFISDDLIFNKRQFSFNVTKKDCVLHLSGIHGLSIEFKGKDDKEISYPIARLDMFTEASTTFMKMKYKDGNQENTKMVRVRFTNTFNGFDQFFTHGVNLDKKT
jgi:hypothetical protein